MQGKFGLFMKKKMLITGASSGIGEAIAKCAAAEEYDLVVVARRKDKLNDLKTEIENSYGVQVEVIEADLTVPSDIKKVVERLKQNDIDVLVNNAGFGSSGAFSELDIDNELNEIDLNIRALVQLTHAGARAMAKKRSGIIINISSIASYQPLVGKATYGATKAFVTSFTHAISEELRPSGIKVLLVCPGLTRTEFFDRSRWFKDENESSNYPNFLYQESDEVAKSVLKSIHNRRSVVIPGLVNKVLASLSSTLPASLTKKITAVVAQGRRTR